MTLAGRRPASNSADVFVPDVTNRVRPGFSSAWTSGNSDMVSPKSSILVLVLGAILWVTIAGANLPSRLLSSLLVDQGHALLARFAAAAGLAPWLKGVLVDGMYLATAWVVSVMLPPMAIFFPCFTLLEDFGFLPRVAFNLDRVFQKVGAHGKQALTMAMGLGCNAAGVVATRIIDSPRERLIAILTNNFSLCNGRWPTQILLATVFIGSLAPRGWAGPAAAASVLAVTLLGFGFALLTSWLLARTVLRGEATSFSLELPPYRPPSFWRTLYTSLIDRTLVVLWRAVAFALPAGAAIWLVANLPAGDATLAHGLVRALDPLAWAMGLTGVVLLAYVVAIPANEIVVPAVLMLTVLVTGQSDQGAGAGVLFAAEQSSVHAILVAGGWWLSRRDQLDTLLAAYMLGVGFLPLIVNLFLFMNHEAVQQNALGRSPRAR